MELNIEFEAQKISFIMITKFKAETPSNYTRDTKQFVTTDINHKNLHE